MNVSEVIWDEQLITKYNQAAPRYTSYPTAVEFNTEFTEQKLIRAFHRYPERPLSLYIHIPFCRKLCYFCACNKVITTHQEVADIYLDALEKEAKVRAPYFRTRTVIQIHLGGGTPTYLTNEQLTRLMVLLRDNFSIATDSEISLELDPRNIDLTHLEHLKNLGFNRLSMGIQDFHPEVQRLVNRQQDEEQVTNLIAQARKLKFHSISLDLIYGLPKQTVESFRTTLRKIHALDPERISLFNFAYLPNLIKAHRMIKSSHLPEPSRKLEILKESINFLQHVGYQFIGMDHFAKQNDELAILQKIGKLHRNFQGYTTHGNSDLLGLGASAISMIGDAYAQNHRGIAAYQKAIHTQGSALLRGLELTWDDCLRRDIIKEIVCNFKVNFSAYEERYSLPSFQKHFILEFKELNQLAQDGLLSLKEKELEVSPIGRLLVRHIALVFDTYSRIKQNDFSKVI
ncbi:MAG: oxygen-independent coproporphyrinogen III oxidase [Neisseriaceae bacterium]